MVHTITLLISKCVPFLNVFKWSYFGAFLQCAWMDLSLRGRDLVFSIISCPSVLRNFIMFFWIIGTNQNLPYWLFWGPISHKDLSLLYIYILFFFICASTLVYSRFVFFVHWRKSGAFIFSLLRCWKGLRCRGGESRRNPSTQWVTVVWKVSTEVQAANGEMQHTVTKVWSQGVAVKVLPNLHRDGNL